MLPIARSDPLASAVADGAAFRRRTVADVTALVPRRRTEDVAARLLERYLRAIARRAAITYADPDGRLLGAVDVGATIDAVLARTQPIVATYWIDDALGVAVLPFVHPAFARLLASVTCVIDDTFAGRAAGRYLERIDGQYALLGVPGAPERLAQVHALMARGSSCAFPVDGGGPYHAVGTGIVTLAASLRAALLPIAAVVRPSVPSLHRSRVRIPLPRTRIGVVVGRPFSVERRDDRGAVAMRLKRALDHLGATARGATRRRA